MDASLLANPYLSSLAAFTGGIAASLSPCVYPMLPIISAFIVGRSGKENPPLTGFLLSVSYTFGMAAVYSGLGVAAALSGQLFGAIATNRWTLLLTGAFFCIFSLLSFGWLKLSLPALPQPRKALSPKGPLGAFCLGSMTGLVASPCTSPVLFALLTFVAANQRPLYGGFLLFLFSLGMGALIVVLGTFSSWIVRRPKPGRWMERLQKAMGLVLLGIGCYYLYRSLEQFYPL